MRLPTALGAVALAVSASILPATSALAAIPSRSVCPPHYNLLSVADLTEIGYMAPALVDEEGNNNGLVCGQPFTNAHQRLFCYKQGGCTLPRVYYFRDDHVIR